ncbi:MAG: sulfatase-like hydrolase/transferase [Candidatus Hodarchaeales archaeon]
MLVQKNVIWILVDSIRNYPGTNDERGKLEIMDKIARVGVEFLNVITSAPSSLMSISAMMSSYPAYYLSRNYYSFKYDPITFPSLPNLLHKKGYHIYTMIFFHEGRKFLKYLMVDTIDQKYWPSNINDNMNWNNESITQILNNILKEGIKEPFFLFIHYNCRDDFKTSEKVEKGINLLKKFKFLDKSILLLTSDHGYPDPSRKLSALEMRVKGHDLIMSDDNIMIPLIITYPGVRRNRKISTTISALDITPTILELLNIPETELNPNGIMGASLLPLIENKVNSENSIYRKIRSDTRFFFQPKKQTSLRDDDFKYVVQHENGRILKEAFFNIKDDPIELNNLVGKNLTPKIAKILLEFRKQFIFEEECLIEFHRSYLKKKLSRIITALFSKRKKIKYVVIFETELPLFSDTISEILRSDFMFQVEVYLTKQNKSQDHNETEKKSFDLCIFPANNQYSVKRKNISLIRKIKPEMILYVDYNLDPFSRLFPTFLKLPSLFWENKLYYLANMKILLGKIKVHIARFAITGQFSRQK